MTAVMINTRAQFNADHKLMADFANSSELIKFVTPLELLTFGLL